MEVDFNNLRMQTAFSLDRVIKILNSGILPETEYAFHEKKSWQGDVLIDKEDIQKPLDELRNCIWTLLCCYEEDNPEYKCVYEEVEKSGGLARFNDEEE
jgi:hypothetical protein